MPTDLLGRMGREVHHGQKRKPSPTGRIHCRRPYFSFELFACNQTADHTSFWGRSPHLEEARSAFWKGERAYEGRGIERGTQNADRKANWKGTALFNGLPS